MIIELGDSINGKTYITRYYRVVPNSIRLTKKPGFNNCNRLCENPHQLVFTGKQEPDYPYKDFTIPLKITSSFKISSDFYEKTENKMSNLSAEIFKNDTSLAILKDLHIQIRNGIYYQTINSPSNITIKIQMLHNELTMNDLKTNVMRLANHMSTEFTAFYRMFDMNGHIINIDNENIYTFRLFQKP